MDDGAASDVGSEVETAVVAAPVRTEVTTTVTGAELCPEAVGDCVTTEVTSSVVGSAEDAVFVMKMVLGEFCAAVEVVSERTFDDTDDAIEEVTEASAAEEEEEVSETWLEVLDEVVEVTMSLVVSIMVHRWSPPSWTAGRIPTGRVRHAGGQAVAREMLLSGREE